jgi:hypothetical protein
MNPYTNQPCNCGQWVSSRLGISPAKAQWWCHNTKSFLRWTDIGLANTKLITKDAFNTFIKDLGK